MSLRSRLLIAIGAIFVLALVVADLVTYSAIESFLYNRVDQQLTQSSNSGLIQYVEKNGQLPHNFCVAGLYTGGGGPNGNGPSGGGPGGAGGAGDGDGDGDGGGPGGGGGYPYDAGVGGVASNAVEEQALWVRSSSGAVVNDQKCSAFVNGKKYSPDVPATLPG